MKRYLKALLTLLAVSAGALGGALAQGTAFTYQGRLTDGGAPASGNYDMRFTLYNQPTNGSLIGPQVIQAPVAATNGLFQASLDFMDGIFNGTNLWLEIAVRTNGSATSYATLKPRQQLTPSPYAIYAEGVNAAGISGTVDAANISGTSLNPVILNNPGDSFTGNGAGLVSLNAGNLTSGVVPDGRLSGTYSSPLNLTHAMNNFRGFFSGDGTGLTNVNAATLTGLSATNFWQIGGNNVAAGQFLGSSNNQPVELRANGMRALRLEPNTNGGPNVIGGSPVNFVATGVIGATIGGGGATNYLGSSYTNAVFGDFGTVGGGFYNTAAGGGATVGGGIGNTATTVTATVSGGDNNTASGVQATVSGGFDNTASADSATVSGGSFNTARGLEATVSGGETNAASVAYATVSGGYGNTASGLNATVSGGYANKASTNNATVSGGYANTASGFSATVSGGQFNTPSGDTANVSGGYGNTASGVVATVGGGRNNAAISPGTTVGGGQNNLASGQYATAGGGNGNTASNTYATVSGGDANLANASYATASGGGNNTASGQYATASGGYGNTANAGYATASGGSFNTASGVVATVGGGQNNAASGIYATVPGGYNNQASGDYSFAAGTQVIASDNNSFIWGDGSRHGLSQGPNSFTALATGGFWIFSGVYPAGIELAPGASSWTTLSDRNAKKNLAAVDCQAVLDKLARVPVQQWNYKWEKDNDVPNIGPMAQDFKAAFYPGRDDKGITTLEFDGVELAAIQGLNQKLKASDAEIQELRQSISELKQLVSQLAQGEAR